MSGRLPERWAFIPDCPDVAYEVSTYGRVRSWAARSTWPTPEFPDGRPKLLALAANDSGYLKVSLGRSFQAYVHRLVIAAHVGPPPSPEEWTVDHIDWDIRNNHLDNLRYLTLEENQARHCPDPALRPNYGHGRRRPRRLKVAA